MTVDLVRRDPAGNVISGTMLAPDEAHRLGQTLIANAFDVTYPCSSPGWTHTELARRAKVDEQFVAQLERGHDRAVLAQALAVLDVLNVHATALPSTAPEDNIHAIDLDAIIDAHA